MKIGKSALVATVALGLSLGVPAQSKAENRLPVGEPGAVLSGSLSGSLSEEQAAELLDETRLLQEAERWRSSGYPDIPVEVLPAEVRELLGVTAGTIPPETFFTAQVQKALLAADGGVFHLADDGGPEAWIARHRANGWPDIPVSVLPEKVREELGLVDGAIPPEVFYGARMEEALTKHLGPVAWANDMETVIDLSHPSITERERENIRQAVKEELGPNAVVVTSPEILRAFEEHAGDEAALRKAIAAAIPSLPADMQQSLQAGFHIQMEDVDLPLRKSGEDLTPERLPTEQVLERISAESRAALADHRDLLDDHWALISALPSLPEETKRAAHEFLGRMQEHAPPALPADMLREIERAKERGYFEKRGAPAATQLLAAIEQRELWASDMAARRTAQSASEGDGYSARREQPFYRALDDYLATHPHLPIVPAAHVETGARNYVVPGPQGSSQIYSRSAFGPRLHVQESNAANFIPHIPNLTIAGHDGTVTWEKHDTGAWTTTVSGFNGRKVFHVSVETKLDGHMRDQFVEMARSIIESGYGL